MLLFLLYEHESCLDRYLFHLCIHTQTLQPYISVMDISILLSWPVIKFTLSASFSGDTTTQWRGVSATLITGATLHLLRASPCSPFSPVLYCSSMSGSNETWRGPSRNQSTRITRSYSVPNNKGHIMPVWPKRKRPHTWVLDTNNRTLDFK